MTLEVTRTSGESAVVIWEPKTDDPRGYLAFAVDSGRLEHALTALGATTIEALGSADTLKQITQSTAAVQRDLERRMRGMVVELKDRQGLSWSEIAALLYDDADKRSSARAAYNAGVRQIGLYDSVVSESDED